MHFCYLLWNAKQADSGGGVGHAAVSVVSVLVFVALRRRLKWRQLPGLRFTTLIISNLLRRVPWLSYLPRCLSVGCRAVRLSYRVPAPSKRPLPHPVGRALPKLKPASTWLVRGNNYVNTPRHATPSCGRLQLAMMVGSFAQKALGAPPSSESSARENIIFQTAQLHPIMSEI